MKLESHKLSLEMELKSLDLSLRGLKRREEACKEELKKAEDETSSLKQNIQRDLQSLEKEEKSLKGNIKLAEDEEKRLKGDVENKKAEIERVRDERVELQRVLDRLKDSAEVLLKKREELLQILAEQKKLAEAADKARATGDLKKLSFDSQQKELEAQYAARLAYLKEENKRRLDTLKRDKEYEIQGKKRLFEELKSQLAELEAQEKQHLDQIEGLRADKARFEQMASNKEGKAKEAELLESRLQHLSASLKQKEQALALVADPRFDVTRIVAEISALQAKKKDLESDKSKVLGELDSLKRENKGLEDQISQAKTSLSSVIETKQGEMRKAQSEVEEKVMRSRREKAEIKQRIAEQYKANEEEKEKAKQWMRAKKEKYEAELIRKLNTAEELRRRMTGGSSAN